MTKKRLWFHNKKLAFYSFLSPVFKIPEIGLLYRPEQYTKFSAQGEQMVETLIQVSPNFKIVFDTFIPLKVQVQLASSSFHVLRDKYMESPEAQAKLLEMAQNPRKKGSFFTNRNFSGGLVASSFHRTKAPRLAAFGSSFYGMKKVLKREILVELTQL